MSNHGWTGPTPTPPPEPPRRGTGAVGAPGGGGGLVGAGVLALVCAIGIGGILNLAEGTSAAPTAPPPAAGDLAPMIGLEDAAAAQPRVSALRYRPLEPRPEPPRTPVAAVDLAAVPFVPFHHKRGEYVGAVRLGQWPGERRAVRDPAYANPQGFFVVTRSLRDHRISPHFTLGDFAMRAGAQGPGGETYLVLRTPLLDKLERVLAELAAGGVQGADFRVLSGFRAPRYNAGVEGSAENSRHMYGDAADVVVDADGDGRMDDLNRDGRVDRADVYVVADAIARVERRHPELVGGLGLYEAQGPSGPFLHVDVRGKATRWGTALAGGRAAGSAAPQVARAAMARATGRRSDASAVVQRPGCRAEGESAAVLCGARTAGASGG